MRIFVYEYICGGGLASQPLPESLQREGWAMLMAVLEDFRRCLGVETVTLLDARFAESAGKLVGTRVDFVEPGAEAGLYREQTRQAEFTVVIAPESDFLLHQRCCWTEDAGGKLLGPSPAAVQLTGDKKQLAKFWRWHDVPTPPCLPFPVCQADNFPLVCKPRRGAGSVKTYFVQTFEELVNTVNTMLGEGNLLDQPILQPHVSGLAASVSLLLGGSWCLALPAATQNLSGDGRFRYLGGSLPLPDELNDRAQRLALRAIAPIDGLSGYVGVDLILGAAVDGSEDMAIEINPRLTTSYVGLRALAEFNLAETMLALALGRPLPERRYRAGVVRFLADGTVEGPHVQ